MGGELQLRRAVKIVLLMGCYGGRVSAAPGRPGCENGAFDGLFVGWFLLRRAVRMILVKVC